MPDMSEIQAQQESWRQRERERNELAARAAQQQQDLQYQKQQGDLHRQQLLQKELMDNGIDPNEVKVEYSESQQKEIEQSFNSDAKIDADETWDPQERIAAHQYNAERRSGIKQGVNFKSAQDKLMEANKKKEQEVFKETGCVVHAKPDGSMQTLAHFGQSAGTVVQKATYDMKKEDHRAAIDQTKAETKAISDFRMKLAADGRNPTEINELIDTAFPQIRQKREAATRQQRANEQQQQQQRQQQQVKKQQQERQVVADNVVHAEQSVRAILTKYKNKIKDIPPAELEHLRAAKKLLSHPAAAEHTISDDDKATAGPEQAITE